MGVHVNVQVSYHEVFIATNHDPGYNHLESDWSDSN